ncbi:MAG: branched-chain amino acid ABC transporter permease, partial [Oscillospiraceae bacterium]
LFTIFVLISLSLFFKKTKIGLAIKGYSSDKLGGIVCGINGKKVCLICFLIGSFLAGACGVLYGSFFSVNPFMGTQPGIKAFAAAVIGGIGSIKGAFLGGLILGFAETFCGAFLSSAYKNSVAFFILIICLCFLPKGFFAKETAEYTDRA